jgi:hypothetical protein
VWTRGMPECERFRIRVRRRAEKPHAKTGRFTGSGGDAGAIPRVPRNMSATCDVFATDSRRHITDRRLSHAVRIRSLHP